jgi:NADH dehydrogenase
MSVDRGTARDPVLKTLGLEVDKRGAFDGRDVARGSTDVSIGDLVPDKRAATVPPPQFRTREARQLAHNLHASLGGRAPRPFRFVPLGALCVVGHHTACAEIKGLRFSGLFAWLLWRGIYVSKLPSIERKVRVIIDWVIELFFPRDIVQTIDLGAQEKR